MSLKKSFKNILGKNYYKFRLTYILNSVFGNYYISLRKKIKNFESKFSFLKKKLDKKIEHQRIVHKESGFLIDGTKNNYLTYHLRPKIAENFNLESTCELNEKIAVIIQGPIQDKFVFLKIVLFWICAGFLTDIVAQIFATRRFHPCGGKAAVDRHFYK